MEPDPLAQLRDVILPPAPGFWPPAMGWWILLLLVIVVLCGAVYLYRYIYSRQKRFDLVKQMDGLARLPAPQAIVELSILMRRIAITRFQHNMVAGLSGEEWLKFLDESGHTNDFTHGPGRALVSAPYATVPLEYPESLFAVCRNWVKTVAAEAC